MANPFPGVNPYIEAEGFWEDFHRRFINYLSEAVLSALPGGYDARIDERIELIDPASGKSIRQPDVSVIESPGGGWNAPSPGRLEVVETAVVEMLPVKEMREVWLEIRDLRDESLVTSIEILSPSNKTGAGYVSFQQKRRRLHEGGANLVDIDLLLGGRRMTFRQPLPAGDCFSFVARPTTTRVQVFSWRLPNPLPPIPIPLREPDPDIQISLNDVYQSTFDRGQYPRRLRYDEPLQFADPEIIQWASSIVRK